MATLLLELFSEEIPSRMQRGAAEQLQRLITTGLEKNMLQAGECKTFVSPRHLAIQIFGLPTIQPDVKEERRGPKIGAPEQAMKGFLTSTGLRLEQCEQRDGYYYATIERKGRSVAEVVKEIAALALADFSWPKSMRWGARELAWVRPLHRITCLLDSEIVEVKFAHLIASNVTEGHRFLSPAPITISHAEKYETLLKAAHVMVDYAARKEVIRQGVNQIAAQQKLSLVEDEGLLDEVTGLVEWPVPLVGEFEAKFLDLPPEVLISEMKTHQRYFALRSADGKLANKFITIANMINADDGKKVMEGNARVVRARLSDGEFYWVQDRKTSLAEWGKKLSDVVFHAKVGMMDQKVARIEKLAVEIAKSVGFADEKSVIRAAQLCKADLTSGMVGEFPELQGIMGRYYALDQKESADIADAIRDHYKPLGANDSVPESKLAAIVAIADKLDSICSLFMANERPTGSKDPLALRRSALGAIRTSIEHGMHLEFTVLSFDSIKRGLRQLWDSYQDAEKEKLEELKKILGDEGYEAAKEYHKERTKNLDSATTNKFVEMFCANYALQITGFFRDRIQNILRDEGIRHDAIEATIAATKGFNPVALAANTRTLATWLETAKGKNTLAAIKRSMNILAAEEKKAKTKIATILGNGDLFLKLEKSEEKALLQAVQQAANRKLENLAELTAPINAFFEACLITEEGFRDARLSLLAAVRDAANTYADFSKLEG